MHDDIQNIQNSLWKYYKDFCQDKDMKKYNDRIYELRKKYIRSPIMDSFCQNLIISWCPIINKIKETA